MWQVFSTSTASDCFTMCSSGFSSRSVSLAPSPFWKNPVSWLFMLVVSSPAKKKMSHSVYFCNIFLCKLAFSHNQETSLRCVRPSQDKQLMKHAGVFRKWVLFCPCFVHETRLFPTCFLIRKDIKIMGIERKNYSNWQNKGHYLSWEKKCLTKKAFPQFTCQFYYKSHITYLRIKVILSVVLF